MNNLLSNSKNHDENDLIIIESSSIKSDEGRPAAKKRKIDSSSIKIEVLQFTNQKLEEFVQQLQADKQKLETKIEKLKGEISSMKTIKNEVKGLGENERETFQVENDKLKVEINDLKNQNEILKKEKKELEAKMKELTDEIASMKNIKSEIKDSVENERETCQTEIHSLKTEIKKVKDKNHVLETKAQKSEIMHLKSENKNKEMEKTYDETIAANNKLEQKCKEFEATITKNMKEYESTMDELKTENQELKNRIQVLENNEREKIVLLDEVSNGTNLDLSLLSCKSNIIMNVSKIEGLSPDDWKLYSTLNQSEKPRFLTEKDMMDTCFKMNITDQFIAYNSGLNLHRIMRKINTCQLTKLHLQYQTIDLLDFIKLTSSKKIQVCILRCSTVIKEQNKCEMDELLMHLPSLTEFEYHSNNLIQNFSTIAENLGKLDKFRNLQKFEIFQYFDSFNIEELDSFIKKNNKDISYVFKFTVHQKALKSKIKRSEKQLLKSLPIPYNIKVQLF